MRPRKLLSLRAFLWILLSLGFNQAGMAQFQAIELQIGPQGDSRVYAVENGVLGGVSTPDGRPGFWPTFGSTFVNLASSTATGEVFAISDGRQFGQWSGRASMWNGTPESLVDFHPVWADVSVIRGADTLCQVGRTQAFATNFDSRATVWFGTAASAVNLHPLGAKDSDARAAWGDRQGGSVSWLQPVATTHAALWSGSAASFVDLNPGPDFASGINGMHGDQQVGTINSLPTGLHAAIWSGTAQSFRDVHPFTNQGSFSQLFATCGSAQVGLYNRGTGVKPGIWFGSRDSFLDLYQFLPPGAGESAALCVEEVNGVFTVGGYARYGVNYRPFVWVGVPAPSSVLPLLAAPTMLLRRRRLSA